MSLDSKRWLILIAGIVANLCQGAAYASSVIAVPMLTHLHLLVAGPGGKMVPDMPKWALAFSINLAMLPLGMLIFGKLADQRSPRLVVALGGLLFGAGIFLSGFSESLKWFYLTFGVMGGLGSGAAYGAIVATSVRWFPDRRGLASGLSVGALGFGTVLIAPIAMAIMKSAPSEEVGVLLTLKILGAAFLAIICLASIVMVTPPKGYAPAGFVPKTPAQASVGASDCTWVEMISQGRFYVLYLLYACGAFSGLMIISQAKPIIMGMKSYGLDPNALKIFATGIVSGLGLANATGRLLWGGVSDAIGRYRALVLMFLITAATMFLLPGLSKSQSTMMVASLLIGACYGGYLGIFPSICADNFGGRNMAVNYALLFSAFAVAAICGPSAGAFIQKSTGSYDKAFIVAGAVASLGFVVSLIMAVAKPKAANS